MTSPQQLDPATLARHREILERHTPRPAEGYLSHNPQTLAAAVEEIVRAEPTPPSWWMERAMALVMPLGDALAGDWAGLLPAERRELQLAYLAGTIGLVLGHAGDTAKQQESSPGERTFKEIGEQQATRAARRVGR